MTQHAPLPCLAIAGPTASGKTAAALALAAVLAKRKVACEIISVDSALVYRSMDIGTAKPTTEEQALLPHHLIDTLAPTESYSAAEFVRDTTRLVSEIRARGALPLLVGGTMLYFKALLHGLDDMPAAHPEVRAAIDARAAELGWPALHAELARVDPVTAARLAPGDSQRIQRALEVWEVTQRPLSSFHTSRSSPVDNPVITPGGLFSLEPEHRSWLHTRIALRFDAMLKAGFLDEVRMLRARGDLHLDLPSMRCVGYRQAWEALDEEAARGKLNLSLLREKGIAATRQLAKRQITWLRSMPERHAIACDDPHAMQNLLIAALQCIDQANHGAYA
jgi:tRNA dimethylallyltransferase